jgi:chlorinating enzyme
MNKFWESIKFGCKFLLAKNKWLHPLLPERVKLELPLDWNFQMAWKYIKSGGSNFYPDFPYRLDLPQSYQPQATVELQYRLSEAEIRSFYEKGYTEPYTLLAPEEMAIEREHILKIIQTDNPIYPPNSYEYVGPQDANLPNGKGMEELVAGAVKVRDRHLTDKRLFNLISHPAIAERCAQLLSSDLMIWRSEFFYAPPGYPGTAWHQVTTYFGETFKTRVLDPKQPNELFQLTVWIAFTDVTVENAPMQVFTGSHHQYSTITVTPRTHKDDSLYGLLKVKIDHPTQPEKVVSLPMKAGQFFIFTERVLHGSLPNTTQNQDRLAVSVRYVKPETKIYHPYAFKYGQDHSYIGMKNLSLDRWKAILVRGEDRFKVNGDRVIDKASLENRLEISSLTPVKS